MRSSLGRSPTFQTIGAAVCSASRRPLCAFLAPSSPGGAVPTKTSSAATWSQGAAALGGAGLDGGGEAVGAGSAPHGLPATRHPYQAGADTLTRMFRITASPFPPGPGRGGSSRIRRYFATAPHHTRPATRRRGDGQ
jgi:hypothetical protein